MRDGRQHGARADLRAFEHFAHVTNDAAGYAGLAQLLNPAPAITRFDDASNEWFKERSILHALRVGRERSSVASSGRPATAQNRRHWSSLPTASMSGASFAANVL